MERLSQLPINQFSSSSSFMTNPGLQKPSSFMSEPISIRTDVPHSSRYADVVNPDVPDLSYDCDYSTPQSASSSNMLPTPVFDWTIPLAGGALDGKDNYPPLLEDWPPSSADLPAPFQSSSSSPSSDLSISPLSGDAALDGLDELNWEKQTHNPELSPCFTTTTVAPHIITSYPTKPSKRNVSPRQSNPIIHHMYSASSSTTKDTHCNHQPMHFSPSQASSSTLLASTCNTISPSALSSASISSTPVHTQPPLKLHQPRPSRRIPIVSLAELASAGEGSLQPTRRRKQSKTTHASVPYPRSPLEALSPLPLDCHGFSPVSEKRELGHLPATSKMNSYHPLRPSQQPNPAFPTLFRQGGLPSKVITCSCGCMESYTIR